MEEVGLELLVRLPGGFGRCKGAGMRGAALAASVLRLTVALAWCPLNVPLQLSRLWSQGFPTSPEVAPTWLPRNRARWVVLTAATTPN